LEEIYILNWMNQTQSFELTGFQRDLLYVVGGSDQPSGQMVRREMEQYVDNVNHGRLYPNLDTLVEHSLVEKGSQDQRTNYYEVTERGKGLILDRRKWENQYVSDLLDSGQVNYASSSSDWPKTQFVLEAQTEYSHHCSPSQYLIPLLILTYRVRQNR